MGILGKIISLVIILVSIDLFIIIYNKATELQLKSINRERKKEAEMLEREYIPWDIEDVRSRSVIVVYSISIIGSYIYHAFLNYDSILNFLRETFTWGILFFLIFLNVRIIVVKTKRIIRQIKGDL